MMKISSSDRIVELLGLKAIIGLGFADCDSYGTRFSSRANWEQIQGFGRGGLGLNRLAVDVLVALGRLFHQGVVLIARRILLSLLFFSPFFTLSFVAATFWHDGIRIISL